MAKYYIDYGTGAGNEYVEGTLEQAQQTANQGASYTGENIKIIISDEHLVCSRKWYGVPFDVELYEDAADVIPFGNFGYYDEWQV